jgi:hypothetical protein
MCAVRFELGANPKTARPKERRKTSVGGIVFTYALWTLWLFVHVIIRNPGVSTLVF